MAVKVDIPELGESVTEAILVEWLKQDGDNVKIDEPICLIETDKADAELPAPVAGVLKRLKQDGDTILVGETVAEIEEGEEPKQESGGAGEQEQEFESAAASAESTDDEEGIAPAVRRLVTENKLDPGAIKGTGKDGRLTKEDVLSHISKKDPQPPVVELVKEVVSQKLTPGGEGVRREPMTRIRKRIAETLVTAQHTAAMLTTFNEVDMSGIFEIRKRYKESFTEKHGVSLGLMSFFVRAAVLSLQEYEAVNASPDGDDVVYHDYVHMGIAVSTERGLVVPVLKHVEQMSFAQIESEIKRIAFAARDGKLGINDLSGGTFSVTNGGVFGSMLSTPILNPPQTGILGMHAIKDRPVAVDGQVVVRPVMYLALTYDHRIVDGHDSVTFLVRMKELLEDPARMMLEV
ncbi:MAG: 2-oxoglutarate dehydrogenase complex dihydrolipoyllysine-residue succinyltransferase [Candidatus Latescibacterota bacterium]|nr:2-oxoglutarate dehydrogenase complex dihydrolipoyllysine-residue succinyltransferase [Candidatus Latescibacterota bacterium]